MFDSFDPELVRTICVDVLQDGFDLADVRC